MTLVPRLKMYLNTAIPIPVVTGKISRQKTPSGTYVHYILERVYDPKKKHTVPKRVIIGRVCPDNDKNMFPNERFFEYFPNTPLPELREEAKRCTTLKAGPYMVIEEQNQGQHYPDYAYRRPLFTADMRIASDSAISRFFSGVTDAQIAGFLNDWNAERDHSSRIYISYDSTNKNCQAGDIDFVEFGKPKSDAAHRQPRSGLRQDQSGPAFL